MPNGTYPRYRQIRVADNTADQASPVQVTGAITNSVTQEDYQYYFLSRLNQVIFGNAYVSHHWYENFLAEGILSLADLTALSPVNFQGQLDNIYSYSGTSQGETDLSALLQNTGQYYVFWTLPGGAGDTIVAGLNALNFQIGNRTYSNSILTDAETVTASVQSLSNHELLDNEPVATGTTYSVTRAGSKVSLETWTNTATTNKIKTIAYAYSGSRVMGEVRTVYGDDGVSIVAQATLTYSYSGSTVTGDVTVRNV